MNTEQIKTALTGHWESIAPEIRPSSAKNPDGTLKPFYLSRSFTYHPENTFDLIVTNFADPYGKTPLARMDIRGEIEWLGEHPIAPGAVKVNFSADEVYSVTPLQQPFADILNQYTNGYQEWKAGETQSIFKKSFPPFGLAEGQVFKEYDLIYIQNDLLFWGARNIDGRGFDSEQNRPTNLQIPLIRR